MNYKLAMGVWVLSFVFMLIGCIDLGAIFWCAFVSFCIINIYMQEHKDRITREIDEDFKD